MFPNFLTRGLFSSVDLTCVLHLHTRHMYSTSKALQLTGLNLWYLQAGDLCLTDQNLKV